MNKLKSYRMIDSTDNFTTKKERLFDLPMRIIMVGKTGDSKSTTLARMLLDKNFYRDDFEADNIFIFSGSFKGDNKLNIIKRELDIPSQNLIDGYDENHLEVLYENLVDEYNEKISDGETDPKKLNSLFVFDDLAYTGCMKANSKGDLLSKIFMNGRKYLISCIVISQKYSSVGTILRENSSGLILSRCSNKQLELLASDHDYLESKKEFIKLYKKTTNVPYSKFIINFSHPTLYQNQDYEDLVDKL